MYCLLVLQLMTIRNWFKRFRASNFDLKDESHSGRLTTDTDRLIKVMLAENLRYSLHKIVDNINISRTTVYNHLIKIEYVNRCEVSIP